MDNIFLFTHSDAGESLHSEQHYVYDPLLYFVCDLIALVPRYFWRAQNLEHDIGRVHDCIAKACLIVGLQRYYMYAVRKTWTIADWLSPLVQYLRFEVRLLCILNLDDECPQALPMCE